MGMERNKIAQYGGVILLVVALVLALKSCDREPRTTEQAMDLSGGNPVEGGLAAALGVEADTEGDTVRTLIAQVKQWREENAAIREENKALRKNNDELRDMEGRIGKGLEHDIQQTRKRVESEMEGEFQRLQQRLNAIEQQTTQLAREPSASVRGGGGTGELTREVVWVSPLGEGAGADAGLLGSLNGARTTLSTRIGADQLPGAGTRRAAQHAEPQILPRYTLPKNATLVNATALTALVGRVPLGSKVTDPYSFKVILGEDNLAANGVEIPDVAYAIASGRAVGDWTLGCVRGDLYSLTFVFEDGTIRTVPKPQAIYEGGGSQADIKIGELSDARGNPCVVGQRITNAYSYLAQRIGVVGVAAAAEAAAASQTTQTVSVGGGGVGSTTTIDGSTGEFILGRTLADSSMEVAKWLDERQAQQFDAIYVQPGASVSLHITEQLEIDYDRAGRKTTYAGFTRGGYRELD
jgi:cell division protein ZapB